MISTEVDLVKKILDVRVLLSIFLENDNYFLSLVVIKVFILSKLQVFFVPFTFMTDDYNYLIRVTSDTLIASYERTTYLSFESIEVV
jgi:hypothetical protein